MELEKAIEILTEELKEPSTCNYQDTLEATKLGIEALKRCQYQSQNPMYWPVNPLPGETES